MKLYIEEKFFSLWGKYNVYYEDKSVAYVVEGKPALMRTMVIKTPDGTEVGKLRKKFFTFLNSYIIYKNDTEIGKVKQKLSFMPKIEVDFKGWTADGDFFGWDFIVKDAQGYPIGTVDRKIWNVTDHFVLDVGDEANAADMLLLVLAISAMDKDRAAASASVSSSD